jgi:hypothetical protein
MASIIIDELNERNSHFVIALAIASALRDDGWIHVSELDGMAEDVADSITPETNGWDSFTQGAIRLVVFKQAKAAIEAIKQKVKRK